MIGALLATLLLQTGALRPDWDVLTFPKVQAELRLTPGQVESVRAALDEARAELDQRNKSGRIFAEAISRDGKIHQIARPKLRRIGETLTASQQERALQITLQEWGANVIQFPGMSDYLHLDKKQTDRIARDETAIRATYWARILAYAKRNHIKMIPSKGGIEVPVSTPGIRRLESKREGALRAPLRADLTGAQNNRLKTVLGRPFAFK